MFEEFRLALGAGAPPCVDEAGEKDGLRVRLDRLAFDGSTIDISGFAPDAASLLLRLGQSPASHDVHFLGPTVRDAASGREHFQIGLKSAEVSP